VTMVHWSCAYTFGLVWSGAIRKARGTTVKALAFKCLDNKRVNSEYRSGEATRSEYHDHK
jgi:hypothetical protein